MLKRPLSLPSRAFVGVLLCVLGAACAVVSAWLIYPPAGVGVAALALMFAGYVTLYIDRKARNASTRQPAASD